MENKYTTICVLNDYRCCSLFQITILAFIFLLLYKPHMPMNRGLTLESSTLGCTRNNTLHAYREQLDPAPPKANSVHSAQCYTIYLQCMRL
jgi:hypothetical protein